MIGGNEDRRYDKAILQQMVDINNAKTVAVIPTATDYPRKTWEAYKSAFLSLGVHEVNLLDIRYHDEADQPEHLEMTDAAELIFFTGGDQERLVNVLNETALIQKIKMKNFEGVTVAGTSAGASAVGNPMILDGNGDLGFQKGAIKVMKGFGFLEGIVVDTHFMERGRIPRLTQILSAGEASMGIGICEETGIILSPDNTFEVIGNRIVTILDSNSLRFTNYHHIETEDRVAVDGIRLSFLTQGMTYCMEKRGLQKKMGTSEFFKSLSIRKSELFKQLGLSL